MCVGMYICTQAHYMLNTLTNSSCKNLIRLETDYTWTAGRSNQSILKEISPGISLEGMMRKLQLQYFGHLMRRGDSLEKTLKLGGIGGRWRRDNRGWDGWMASPTRWTWVWVNSGSWWWTGRPGVLIHGVAKSRTERLNWLTGIHKETLVYFVFHSWMCL